MDGLDTLRPEVMEAAAKLDDFDSAFGTGGRWQIIRAELLRLATIEADALIALDCEHDWQVEHKHAEKAESELATLRARILPGAAKVEIIDANDPDGNPYGWVGDTPLPHNLIGKRVRLLAVENDDG